ncbi:Hint domain-containing protein [Epibacterium ulvae]|uniref:Hint domain-containing protein n=1 Tax=Epibacterium ulvae TaxID=1156985 RepID=UPI001BFC0463|nr:Hint domain-containing protein [Epibacterium ulvae]MBT8155381.1 Hint domain-containing protein [Epibacterium ulvae]
MARISELHYSNAYAASSGVSEFLEVALSPSEDPADFTVSFYQSNGQVGIEIPLTHPDVQVSVDPDNGEIIYVISADDFNILLTDPDGGGSNNYEAYALTNIDTSEVIDFYDIGGGTQNIVAVDGLAAGETSDNLAVLVGPNSTTTTLQFNQPNPDTLVHDVVGPGDTGIACFTAGTLVDTPSGPRRVEALRAGDLVLTQDHGPQVLRWSGQTTVRGQGEFAPVRIAQGVLGAEKDIYVSPQHRILVQGWQAELVFGADEVLVPAKALVDGEQVTRADCDLVTYVHLLFDDHQLLRTHGLVSESFLPAGEGMKGWEKDTAEEIYALFPELRLCPDACLTPVRMIARTREAAMLAGLAA